MSAGRRSALALTLLAAIAAAETAAAQATIDRRMARLQGLDKITARVSQINVPVGEATGFGTLEITVRACRSTPPEQAPENAAFLEIVDQRPDEPAELVFSGWMFSSSPAVSALDHPVFDVWVVECSDALPPDPEEAARYPRGANSLPDNPPLPPSLPPERGG